MAVSSSTLQWLSLVGIVWLQTINGTNTDFPAYSSQLKDLLSMSQIKLNILAFGSDAGKLLGWISGLATLYLPLWVVLLIGATLGLIGYGVQFLFLVNKISFLSYGHVFLLTVLAGNSICWINTVCYAITIKNFPYNRQLAVGLSTSYVGLSAKAYTDIVDVISPGVPNKKAKSYVLMNSLMPLMVSVLTAPLFRDVKVKKTRGLEMGFVVMFIITAVTGVYAVISSLRLLDGIFSPLGHAIGLGVLLATPLLIPLATKAKEVCQRKCRVHGVVSSTSGELRDEERVKEEEGQEISEKRVIEEIGSTKMMSRIEFWLYFFVYMFGGTLGLVYLNNLGQIAESRGHSKTASLVSLSSSFQFFGRLMPALLDYLFPRSNHVIPRPALIAILMTPMAGSFFLLLHPANVPLYLSTAIIGVSTGAISSLAVSLTTELFGTKNFNVNHNIVVGNIPVGSFVFGYLAALLYQREAGLQKGNGICMGDECYNKTFLLWGTICSFGTLLSLVLYTRTRKFYSQSF